MYALVRRNGNVRNRKLGERNLTNKRYLSRNDWRKNENPKNRTDPKKNIDSEVQLVCLIFFTEDRSFMVEMKVFREKDILLE